MCVCVCVCVCVCALILEVTHITSASISLTKLVTKCCVFSPDMFLETLVFMNLYWLI